MIHSNNLREQFINDASMHKVPWEGTAEDFYFMVRLMYATENPENLTYDMSDPQHIEHRQRLEAFGKTFSQVYDIDFAPYESFSEMIDEVEYGEGIADICEKGIALLQGTTALEEVMKADEQITLSEETKEEILGEDLDHDILMKRMAMFFTFKPEDKE